MTLGDQFGLPIDASFNQNQYPGGRFHAHPQYEIYYFHGGGCTYLIGGRMFELAPGDLIILHGMTLHAPIIDPRRPYVRTIVHFDPAFAAGLLRPPFQADALAPFRDFGNARVRLARGRHGAVPAAQMAGPPRPDGSRPTLICSARRRSSTSSSPGTPGSRCRNTPITSGTGRPACADAISWTVRNRCSDDW